MVVGTDTQINTNEQCLIATFCHYVAKMTFGGSDTDDNIALIKGLVKSDGTEELFDEPIDYRNFVELEAALDALGCGEWAVTPTGSGFIQFESVDNPSSLKGIIYRFDQLEATDLLEELTTIGECKQVYDADNAERCDYYAERKAETGTNDKLYYTGIKFENGTIHRPLAPIDTSNPALIAAHINSIEESEEKFKVWYTDYTLKFYAPQLKYLPTKVHFTFHTKDVDESEVITNHETDFIESNCNVRCIETCGGEGELPCNNGTLTGHCNGDLVRDANGLCNPPVRSGQIYINGAWQSAGGLGQLPDGNGKCTDGLVPTAHGCQPSQEEYKVADYSIEKTVNPAEELISITIGNLGTFPPLNKLIFGDGTDILEWLNNPETGIVPLGSTDVFGLVMEDVADSDLKTYKFQLTDVAIDFSNIEDAIQTTVSYCENGSYEGCVRPSNARYEYKSVECGIGQRFNRFFLQCEETVETDTMNIEQRRLMGLCHPCNPQQPELLKAQGPDYAQRRATLIQIEINAIQQNTALSLAVHQYFQKRAKPVDFMAYAVQRLVQRQLLPSWEAPCLEGMPTAI